MTTTPRIDQEGEKDVRKIFLIALLAVVVVAVGYIIVLLLGGRALTNFPLAKEILELRQQIAEFAVGPPLPAPIAPLAAETPKPSPSPVTAEPSPSPSPSPTLVPPSPDAPSVATFTITYENTTGVQLTDVGIRNRIPAGTNYRSGSAQPQAAFDGQQLVWQIGTLDPGAAGTVRFQVFAAKGTTITNRAAMTSNEAPTSEVVSSVTVG